MYSLCPNTVQISVLFLSRSVVTPRHRCVIMNNIVNESLRKICHYQYNVLQHYYLLDILVLSNHCILQPLRLHVERFASGK